MSLADKLTPKNTEEIKPGLFIQKTASGYRSVTPAAWEGKINWKVTLLGSQPLKHLFVFALLMFLAYGYFSGTISCDEFQSDPCKYLPNITSYCNEKTFGTNPFGILESDDAKQNTYSLQDPIK